MDINTARIVAQNPERYSKVIIGQAIARFREAAELSGYSHHAEAYNALATNLTRFYTAH